MKPDRIEFAMKKNEYSVVFPFLMTRQHKKKMVNKDVTIRSSHSAFGLENAVVY